MNALETLELASSVDITIELKPQSLKLVVTPKEKITEDLDKAIRANRDAIIAERLYTEAVAYLARITHGKPEKTRRTVTDVFEKHTVNLALPDISLDGYESSLRSPEVVKAILANACSKARDALMTAEEDRRLEETGVIQNTEQVLDLAKEKLGK